MKLKLHQKIIGALCVPGIVLICVIGWLADCLGMENLADWCARQLTDTDGQDENANG